MIYCPSPFDQWMTPKGTHIEYHVGAHFGDTLKRDIFNLLPKKGICLYLGSSIRGTLHSCYHGRGAAYERFNV